MRHVDADLMGSPRLQPARNKACFASKVLDEPPMGQRAAAAPGRHDGDILAARGMTGERRVDGAGRPRGGAPNEGQIRAGER